MGRTVFNPSWKAKYKWVSECKADNHQAYCSVCRKTIELCKMGESALKSHMAGAKHLRNETLLSGQQLRVTDFAARKTASPTEGSNCPSTSRQQQSSSIVDFTSSSDVLKAEVLWTLKTVSDHSSYRSNEHVSPIFRAMFPDSNIASKFTCGERKTAYLSVFGIAPYFLESMKKQIKGKYCILFDESLNKKSQSKQMDLHVRYWTDENRVVTRYLGSQFLGHATAEDMLKHFQTGVLESGLDVKEMQQVSMDGPNVNWAFLNLLKKKLADDYDSSVINIGSCGLHIVHNSFKTGAAASGWDIGQYLSSLYYLFKDAPARKEDFSKIWSGQLMPLKFVNHRWLENVQVCKRALVILNDVDKFVKAVEQKQLPKPTCKSYTHVSTAIKDKLLIAKLEFFNFVALHLQTFLTVYQTDRPMTPFLSEDLSKMVRALLKCIMKGDKLVEISDERLSRVFDDKENYLPYKKFEIGFLTEKHLAEAIKGGVSERQVMEFIMDCKNFIEEIVKKVLQKCPISYSFVRNLSSLNPQLMATKSRACQSKFKKVVTFLESYNRIKGSDCDLVINQYMTFLENIPKIGSDIFASFDHKAENARLDELFTTYMKGDQYSKLLEVVRIILVLSHGQATVERGFSVNKEIEVENMSEQTLVAQRLICDNVRVVGGALNVQITKPLLVSCSFARQKYEQYLENQRAEKKTAAEQHKRKADLDQLDELKKKKQRMDNDISSLIKSADEYAEKAESTGQLTFLAKSNALRRSAKDKALQIKTVEDKIQTKQGELKSNSSK